MKNIILCGLDGTLANIEHRLHYIKKKPCPYCYLPEVEAFRGGECGLCNETRYVSKPDWKAFHKACVDDTPINSTISLLAYAMERDVLRLWIVSGRSDEVGDETVQWINDNVGSFDRLIMRKAGDYTPDDQLKEQWLLDGTIPKDRVLCVFDDRRRVVDMWRRHGLTCYQVAEGEF